MSEALKKALDLALKVYHSSPHKFDRFDLSKIGTGEGAQVYGHGLYFAESPKVSGQGGNYWNMFYNRMKPGPEQRAATSLIYNNFDPSLAIEALRRKKADYLSDIGLDWAAGNPEMISGLRTLARQSENSAKYLEKHGRAGPYTYEVQINEDPSHFLDWMAPLREQSPHIQGAVGDFAEQEARKVNAAREASLRDKDARDAFGRPRLTPERIEMLSRRFDPEAMTGAHIYGAMQRGLGAIRPGEKSVEAAQALSDRGVVGTKYFDAASRDAGEGSRNYVTFSDKPLEILRRYAGGGSAGYASGGLKKLVSRAIEKFSDPPAQYIKDWNWRSLPDVHADIGGINKLPEHIYPFGRFMNEMADKAATEGFDPEDAIKAYMITRSSIGRGGVLPASLMRRNAFITQPEGRLMRPEGQMAEWLRTPTGIRFLNEARKGDLSQDVVEDAQRVMFPFGKNETVEPPAMDWARRNLPSLTPWISDMVRRSKAGDSPIEEWRRFARGAEGIGPAKTGFLGSLLGRGDLPTLDARQIILQTGLSNEAGGKLAAKQGGKWGEEAVDRLAARQEALGLGMPKAFLPNYQHLTHHAIWDAAGNSQTTHGDIINTMKPRAAGGRTAYQVGGYDPDSGVTGEVSFAPEDPVEAVIQRRRQLPQMNIPAAAPAPASHAVSPNPDTRPATPSTSAHTFVQQQLNTGERQLPQYDKEAEDAWKEGLGAVGGLAAYTVPVLGEGMMAYDLINAARELSSPEVRKAAREGDYWPAVGPAISAGLAGLGAPAVWRAIKKGGAAANAALLAGSGAVMAPDEAQATIFGEAAKMAPRVRSALEAAKSALASGSSPRQTWARYGWAPDPSGKMVSELSDRTARLIPEGLARFRAGDPDIRLGEVLSHPNLFDLYPSSVSKKLTPFEKDIRERGYYNPILDVLGSNVRLSDRDLLENILHEHQHRIQHVEGMSPGTTPEAYSGPEYVAKPLVEELQSLNGAAILHQLLESHPELGGDSYEAFKLANAQGIPIGPQPMKYMYVKPHEIPEATSKLQDRIDEIYATTLPAYEQYHRSLGEWMARMPGERLELGPVERRADFPFSHNYPVIVRPPSRYTLPNERSPWWESERERAIEQAKDLQRVPLPVRHSDIDEQDMATAMAIEAAKRAKRAGGGGIKNILGKLFAEGSGYRGVPGKPSTVNLPGIGRVEARPIPEIEAAAAAHNRAAGLGSHEIGEFAPINPVFSAKVARAFERMKHDPSDPDVRRAYDAMIADTMAQYRAAKDTGIDFRFLKEGQADPYAASPALGYADIINKGRLFVFPTDQGFGTLNSVADNPLLRRVGRVGDKSDAVANDAFRIVHDLYGHFGPGNPFFRAPGEERAFQLHSKMFSPEGLPAATSETRGQNSWVNYGPAAEANRTASGADTVYADQKIGRMPDWAGATPPAADVDVDDYIRSLIRRGRAGGGLIQAGLKLARVAAPKHGISSVVLDRPVEQMTRDVVSKGVMQPRIIRDPSELKGTTLVAGVGDKTDAGKWLTGVMGEDLAHAVNLPGGPDYARTGPSIWASARPKITRLQEIADSVENPMLIYTPMSHKSGDYSLHMADTVRGMIPGAKIPRGNINDLNAMLAESLKKEGIEAKFPGLKSRYLDEFLFQNPGARSPLFKRMDKRDALDLGAPSVAHARFAVTNPDLLDLPINYSGYTLSRMRPKAPIITDPAIPHPTYSTQLAGEYFGGLEHSVPPSIMFRDFYNQQRPETLSNPAKLGWLIEKMIPTQKVDQQLIDEASQYIEAQKKLAHP